MKKILNKAALFILALTACFCFAACGGASGKKGLYDAEKLYEGYDPSLRIDDVRELSDAEYSIFNTAATGDFENHSYGAADGLKADKTRHVGMFYFLTLGEYSKNGIFDVTKNLKQYGGREQGFDGDFEYSPVGEHHWWGEPALGYYNAADPYVIRKHVEQLTFAGIDFIYLDTTNGALFPSVTKVLLPIIKEYRDAGWPAPQVAYYFNTDDEKLLREVYEDIYGDIDYEGIWFSPEGKPLVVVQESTYNKIAAAPSDAALADFFDYRFRQWPNENAKREVNGFPWMDWEYPQALFKQKKDNEGIMNVSVSQHTTGRFSDTDGTRGKGYEYGTVNADNHERFEENLNLQEQWETVYANDEALKIVTVTGWNEWTGEKYRSGSTYYMIDTFNDEYSRDLEPTKTGNGKDNAYILNNALTRKWKHADAKHYKYDELSPASLGDAAWESAKTFIDFTGENILRDELGADRVTRLTDSTPRNDIARVSVAHDSENMYFKIACAADITKKFSNDKNWMNLHIKTRNSFDTDALGYHFVLNKNVNKDKTEVNIPTAPGSDTYKSVGEAGITVSGRELLITVPLRLLGLSARNFNIEFKVSDNVSQKDVLDFYTSGDSAPCGRINYVYGY